MYVVMVIKQRAGGNAFHASSAFNNRFPDSCVSEGTEKKEANEVQFICLHDVRYTI